MTNNEKIESLVTDLIRTGNQILVNLEQEPADRELIETYNQLKTCVKKLQTVLDNHT